MNRFEPAFILSLAAALFVSTSGCDPEPLQGEACDLVAGDLVFSEVLPNPVGDDKESEWIEIYNASGQEVVLDRVTLVRVTFPNGLPDADGHIIRGAGTIPPRSYFVMGNSRVIRPPLNYSYNLRTDRNEDNRVGETFSDMVNSGNYGLVMLCGDRVIDEMWYGGINASAPIPPEGRSLGVDGSVAPDALLNDDGKWWCSGGEAYDGINIGTPGGPNVACGLLTCEDTTGPRDVMAPAPGDVVISEMLLNPLGTDSSTTGGASGVPYNKYWLELFIAGGTVDLNRLEIVLKQPLSPAEPNGVEERMMITGDACVTAMPNQYFVIGGFDGTNPEQNGGAPVDVVIEGFDLEGASFWDEGGGTIELVRDGVVIDVAGVPANIESGASVAWDGLAAQLLSPADSNDDPSAFCAGVHPMPPVDPMLMNPAYVIDRATPGEPNWECGTAACRDPTTTDIRAISRPAPGELIITEVVGDASGSDTNKEWIEIYVDSATPVDLNGLLVEADWLTSGGNPASESGSVAGRDCFRAAPMSYAVVSFYDPAADPMTVDNGGLGCACMSCTASLCNGLDPLPTGIVPVDGFFPNSNDLTVSIGLGGVVYDSASVLDAVSGQSWALAGTPDTTANDDTCNFALSTVTGYYDGDGSPGVANPDPSPGPCLPAGMCLEGMVQRATLAPAAGDLVITEIYADPSGTDDGRDWLEIYIVNGPVDLNGVEIVNTAGSTKRWTLTHSNCLVGNAGAYFVVSGVPGPGAMDQLVSPDATIGPQGDSLFFGTPANFELYMGLALLDATVALDATSGKSDSVMPGLLSPVDNDSGMNWCKGAMSGAFMGGQGSPGVANQCE